MPAADVTLDTYAERIYSELDGGPPAVLVGQSLGGMAIPRRLRDVRKRSPG